MEWPQITFIVLLAINFGIVVTKHGQPGDPYNVGVWIVRAGLWLLLLYMGGFFS